MDPQQRVLLECVQVGGDNIQSIKNFQECIENGGVTDCSGTGMFVGLMEKEYQEMSQTKTILSMLGSMASVLSGRLNYVFDCYGTQSVKLSPFSI